jgi:hypothetical protein
MSVGWVVMVSPCTSRYKDETHSIAHWLTISAPANMPSALTVSVARTPVEISAVDWAPLPLNDVYCGPWLLCEPDEPSLPVRLETD